MVDYQERLKRAVIATDKAARALHASLREIEPVRPISAAELNPEGGITASICESFVMRFSRLQDIMGAQLFPNVVACLEMDQPPGSRDALDRLESYGLLTV